MAEKSKGISVACAESQVLVRLVGRGTFQNSQPLRRFALEMIDQGYREFVVDLGQSEGMDSTFLGVLAGIGLRLRQNGSQGTVHIVNVKPRDMELLQTLGLDRLFSVDVCKLDWTKGPGMAKAKFQKLPDSDLAQGAKALSKTETERLCLEAHENLARVDQRNEPKFKDVTKFLRENIQRRNSKKEES